MPFDFKAAVGERRREGDEISDGRGNKINRLSRQQRVRSGFCLTHADPLGNEQLEGRN